MKAVIWYAVLQKIKESWLCRHVRQGASDVRNARECPSGAVTVENNIAHIDTSKCTNCGTCASLCPRKVFTGPDARKES